MARNCSEWGRLCPVTEGCHVKKLKQTCYYFTVMTEVSQVVLSLVLVIGIVQRTTDGIIAESLS